ncbi:uncharacterized protein LOC130786327 isoform X2 [Actinidia eriantha]|uniref:uncharacterized protein LOC130786327 isoform X2 n=1 Tax=Actinidia eriantha TaxID=165200 RepID=UPI00258C7F1A|nr:uncharacterized protein LOC130786327 isoform X2 [Actinidia eriantha]
MERVRTIFTHTHPYPHEHSHHAIIAVAVGCLFFISSDNMHTIIQKLDNNRKWWSMYACLLAFFYFFSSPFLGKTIKPSYSNFSRWHIAWILVASLYHLSSFQSMGVDMRMNLSLFLTIYVSSILFLLVFHVMFLGLWYVGLVACVAGKRPAILAILQNCAVISIACCVVYNRCGNRAILREKPFERTHSGWFSFWKKEEQKTWLAKFLRINEFKDEICSSWFAPVGSASDYSLLSKWVIYGELACSGSCPGSSDEISPIYSLWATFVGLYIANYVVERSTGYPNPSAFTYEKRFFRPFEYALQPPPWYKEEHVAVNKPELHCGVSKLKQYGGPQCFVIPGNHDWFDGLQTFMRYICHRSWLGGWLMPQKKSYFALQLPKGWWVFGLDHALHCDIDVYQFKFFSELIKEKLYPGWTVGENDSVIIMTHEPNWLIDWYWDDKTGKNISYLICEWLKGRCKLWMAGDLHHYMRRSYVPSDKPANVQHLLVNGCGGAFLHPTHVFSNFNKFCGTSYKSEAAYPSFDDSSKIALGNILKFRKKNWQFDFIGGIIYFVLAFSMFPQCKLDHVLQDDAFSGHLWSFFSTAWDAFMFLLGHSFVSSAALILMLLLEIGVEMCIRHKLLATSGYHTLYQWYQSVESEHFPDPTGLRARIEQWTFGHYPACIKYLMSAFDVPEVMAVTRTNICKNGMESLSRGEAVIYYASVFLYFWVFSTPVVSLVFGSYLYICINWLHLHFDETFSSLRIANYKAFTRFHIKQDGDLEVFTLAVDKVPKEWKVDPQWEAEPRQLQQPSHLKKFPSKWCAVSSQQDPLSTVRNLRIVDHFVIRQTGKPNIGANQ